MAVKDGVRDMHASCDYKGNEHGPHVGPYVTWDYGYEIVSLVHAYVYCSNVCSDSTVKRGLVLLYCFKVDKRSLYYSSKYTIGPKVNAGFELLMLLQSEICAVRLLCGKIILKLLGFMRMH
ncbi:hypothetical protein Tco_0339755, partial [Tanacetum coccineum]